MNPYKEKPYDFPWVTDDPTKEDYLPLEPRSFVVDSNPGFAPILELGQVSEIEMKFDGYCFSDCTSPYGVKRRGGNRSVHSGIDLGTNGKPRPVIALIYGDVWVCSEKEVPFFGNVMFIKGKGADANKLYFLAHLVAEGRLPAGTPVEPGDKVATAGNTTGGKGTSTGVHLHVEVFRDVTEDKPGGVLNLDKINTAGSSWEWWKNPRFVDKRVDPFVHTRHVPL